MPRMQGGHPARRFNRAGAGQTKTARGKLSDPVKVARDGYDALISDDDHIVTTIADKLMVTAAKFMPDKSIVQRVE